ncbi:Tfp pilus assembly protein FimT/FimU [Planctomycetota bacterium]
MAKVKYGNRNVGRYGWHGKKILPCTGSAFSMVELLIVMIIISIIAMLVIPMIGSASGMQLSSAANMIAADLEYAKGIAIGRGLNYSVIFDTSSDSYKIEDQNGSTISHPVKKGFDYVIDFGSDSRLDKVSITDVDFDGTASIKFDYLGCPYNGNNTALNSGVVTLTAGETTVVINVEPITGFISITE